VRCVGIGKCRREHGGVMCPSYMVTREEKHSTRGRARLLWELLNGEEQLGSWRSKEVFEALDLCLACKGCTSECPVHVDMPTYKAEFLSRYYARRLRPVHAYAFGLIDRAARTGARTPRLANAVAGSRLARRALGVAPERHLPSLASQTLKQWFFARDERREDGLPVVLWADTFTNYFEPEVGIAAVEALEEAGHRVTIPREHLCCGRPLYDYGMLGRAERYLNRVLARLRDDIRAGTPVVGIEPSCVAVFKDELRKLLPHDEDAKRLAKQTFHFGEFLGRHEPPSFSGNALLHGHCHQKATGGLEGTRQVLERMGLEVEVLDSGCCGMAGAWGYERDHYDVSMACGERVLFPAVRRAADETLVVADGFSCRNQIEAGTGREALQLAEVLRLARKEAA
jgi:Fe-S oxidoreductase